MQNKFGISTLVKSSGNKELIDKYDLALEGKIPTEEFFKLLAKDKDHKEVMSYYLQLYKKYKKQDERIWNLIKELKNKVKFACLTDTNDLHFQTHKEERILDKFDYPFASFQLGSKKSDKAVFTKVLSKLEIKPEEAIFVDDNIKNIENAQSLGINSILFESYEKLVESLKKFNL